MAPTSIEKRGRNSYSSDADEEASLPLYDMSRDESTLPLYAAGSSSAARERPALPDKKATPQEIRDFLTELLVATRGLPVPEAQAIASAWRLGSGQELLGYPPQMYRQLFGNENGWVVCKEARLLITETEWKKGMGKRGTGQSQALYSHSTCGLTTDVMINSHLLRCLSHHAAVSRHNHLFDQRRRDSRHLYPRRRVRGIRHAHVFHCTVSPDADGRSGGRLGVEGVVLQKFRGAGRRTIVGRGVARRTSHWHVRR